MELQQKKLGQTIYKMDILGEYKRRSKKILFGVTTKIVTKLNKNKSKSAN